MILTSVTLQLASQIKVQLPNILKCLNLILEYHVVIKFLTKKNKSSTEIKRHLDTVFCF